MEGQRSQRDGRHVICLRKEGGTSQFLVLIFVFVGWGGMGVKRGSEITDSESTLDQIRRESFHISQVGEWDKLVVSGNLVLFHVVPTGADKKITAY